jgi:hypothetical protein
MKKFIGILLFYFCLLAISYPQKVDKKDIQIKFKGDAQIEVGNHYVGAEFHHSFPLPQRISFYYPVANSIDMSTDYWKRDSTFIGAIGIQEDGKEIEWLGKESYEFVLTPFSVKFSKTGLSNTVNISYEFCNDKPAMIASIEINNNSGRTHEYSVYTSLKTSLKTSHTFVLKKNAWTEYDNKTNAVYTNHLSTETQQAQVFVANTGEIPIAYSGHKPMEKEWSSTFPSLDGKTIKLGEEGDPAAAYSYKRKLAPNEKLEIVQIIGSAGQKDGEKLVEHLRVNYKKEVADYEQHVLNEVNKNLKLTGDSVIDKSIIWAKAVLAVNKHYIDGSIQPMPCPAEYNFHFSHDVFLTDLAAVNFDLPRVKKDLAFIIEHADKDKIIPHAYYWKDSAFVTEYATPDNWNHFWFMILSASYLRHSSDTLFAAKLYPYIEKSLEQALQNEKDGIIWAYRPDWWDIGRKYGAKSYVTVLAAQSLKYYLYMSKALHLNENKYDYYEKLIGKMKHNLNTKLWDDEKKYLMDYFEDGSRDEHYYMGPLLAVVFDMLDEQKAKELVHTAENKLLDEKLGVYTIYPMDFHKLIDFYKFSGDEAGAPFKYINGGIWPHSNAWYFLSLLKIGEKEKAEKFLKRTMTLDGIINSPNGQPAMYEYRNSNYTSPAEYGKVDKPQFMWAAGWYMYCVYSLYFN